MGVPWRLLVADDDRELRRLITRVLEAAGYSVIAAVDGAHAVELAREQSPDLLVLDVHMPGADGFSVCREVQQAAGAPPPVIFLSASGDVDSRVCGLESGAVDYIVKPFAPAELRARVQAALRTKAIQDQLVAKATTDGLTGVLNRGALEARAAEAISLAARHGRALCCVMADVDHFKRINDAYGHAAGDDVLREVVARIRTATRGTDVVARYGGEEFVALLPDTDLDGGLVVAEKIRGAIAATPVHLNGGEEVPVTASLGVAAWSELVVDAAALLAAADACLYRAKALGRNQCVVAPHATTWGLASRAA